MLAMLTAPQITNYCREKYGENMNEHEANQYNETYNEAHPRSSVFLITNLTFLISAETYFQGS